MSDLEQSLGRRFARLTTNLVVARPALWRLFRPLTRMQFDRLAPQWTSMRSTEAFAALELALDALPAEPSKVLDLGTGTGLAAFAVARRFPGASVVGSDIAEEMLVQAREATPPELADRVRFEAADAAQLPFPPGSFDLVVAREHDPVLRRARARGRPGRSRAPLVLGRTANADLGAARAAPRGARSPRIYGLCGLHGRPRYRVPCPPGRGRVISATKGRSRRGSTGPDVLSSRGHGYTSRPAAR